MKERCLVLCSLGDRSAARVYCALRERLGPTAVEVVSAEELLLAPHWRYGLEGRTAQSEVVLFDGRRIDPSSYGLAFQRIRAVELTHFARARAEDRDYARAEMHALLLAWLASFPCLMVNRAGPRGLCGAERGRVEWTVLAHQAELPVRAFELASDARLTARADLLAHLADGSLGPEDPPRVVRPELLGRGPVQRLERLEGGLYRTLVAGARCSGVPEGIDPGACLALAKLSGDQLLEIRFGMVRGGWRFFSATPVPDLSAEDASFVAETLVESVVTV